MNSETWLEMAARLQRSLNRRGEQSRFDDEETAARERIELALWLRHAFSPANDAEKVIAFGSDAPN